MSPFIVFLTALVCLSLISASKGEGGTLEELEKDKKSFHFKQDDHEDKMRRIRSLPNISKASPQPRMRTKRTGGGERKGSSTQPPSHHPNRNGMPPASYFDQKSQQDTFRAAECIGQAANCLVRYPAHGIGQVSRETFRGAKAYIEQDYKKAALHGLKAVNSAICSTTACLAYTAHHTNQAINHASSAIGHGLIKQFAEYNDSHFTAKQDQKRTFVHQVSLDRQNKLHLDKLKQQHSTQLQKSKSFYDH